MKKGLGRGLMLTGGVGLATTAFFVATGGMGAAAAMGLTVLDCGALHVGSRMSRGESPLAEGPKKP